MALLLYHSSPMIMLFFFLSFHGVVKIRIMTYFKHDFMFHIRVNWGGNFKLAFGADALVNTLCIVISTQLILAVT